MNKKEKLLAFLHDKGLTQQSVAQRFGVSQAYINSLVTGRAPFGKRQAQRWHDEFGISAAWLLTGEGEMFPQSPETTLTGMKMVPLIPSTAFAGAIQAISEGIMPYECTMVPSPYQKAQFAMTVSGQSMEPKFPEGCTIFMSRIDDRLFIPWGYPHVLDTINGAFLKNIYPIDGNAEYFQARSINPEYPPFDVPFKGVYGFYQVLGLQLSFDLK